LSINLKDIKLNIARRLLASISTPWFSFILIFHLAYWLFLEQGGTWWQYKTHKWYATRKSLGTTGIQPRLAYNAFWYLQCSFQKQRKSFWKKYN